MEKRCIFLGGGGHAAVLIEILKQKKGIDIVGILDPNFENHEKLMGIPYIGNDNYLPKIAEKVNCFVVGVGTDGNCFTRKKLFEFGLSFGLEAIRIIHPNSILTRSSEIGNGSQVLAGSVVNTNARIGENCIIDTGAIIEHDCIIGSNVYIGVRTSVCGGSIIGDNSFVDSGVIIKKCSRIPESSQIRQQ